MQDFPQDEFRRSLANGEMRECPICLDEFGANDLCCIFDCGYAIDYPFGHYLCNGCAQQLLTDDGETAKCPVCRQAGLKPHN
ncbi:MAG: hypothetical protein IJG00_04730 [Clostridia bacterium]|nr:hypothetical protein [Clostridia bacterium]